jgi:hypothetical protein
MSDSLPPGEQPARRNSAWIWGLILILIGAVFLLQNLRIIETVGNWWAVFILIPAFASFAGAWAIYQRRGRFSRAAVGPLTGGLVLLLVALIFLLDLDWGQIWPVFLIIFGIGALISSIVE